MRALRRTLTLLPLFMGCAHPAPVPASDPDDPYAALERLSTEIDRSVAWARAAAPSRVPRGDAAGALNILRLLLRSIDEEIAWADTERPYFVHQDTRFAKLALGNPDNLYTVVRVDDDGAPPPLCARRRERRGVPRAAPSPHNKTPRRRHRAPYSTTAGEPRRRGRDSI